MHKRGQIFIFAAIIIGLVTFLLFTKPNTMHEEILLDNFGQVSQNYLTEMPKVVDNSIYNEELVEDNLQRYTNDFLVKYARRELDPNVGIIYIYTNGTDIIVDNHLNNEIVTFTGLDITDVKIFSSDEQIEGSLVLEGTGITGDASTSLCETIDLPLDQIPYCIIKISSLFGKDDLTLKIGDYSYDFKINTQSPNLIAIIKSSEGNTTKVDTFQTEI